MIENMRAKNNSYLKHPRTTDLSVKISSKSNKKIHSIRQF